MKYLVVGLGNIGNEYAETRHNIGFKVLDAFAMASNTSFKTERYGDVAEVRVKGRTFVLLKPSTFMNLSGNAVRYWMQKERIAAADILVVVDDLALPVGTNRLRGKGSDGGHNGLKSIDSCLATNGYPRLRCGIGAEFSQGHQVNYVLGEWRVEEKEVLKRQVEQAIEVIISFGTQGLERTMNTFNKKGVGNAPTQKD